MCYRVNTDVLGSGASSLRQWLKVNDSGRVQWRGSKWDSSWLVDVYLDKEAGLRRRSSAEGTCWWKELSWLRNNSLYAECWDCRREPSFVLTGRFKHPNGGKNLWVYPSINFPNSLLLRCNWQALQSSLPLDEDWGKFRKRNWPHMHVVGGWKEARSHTPSCSGASPFVKRENTGGRDTSKNLIWNTGAKKPTTFKRSQIIRGGV